MATSSAATIQGTMTGNSTSRQKTGVPQEVSSYTRPILNNGGGIVVYPTYLPPIINQPVPGVLNHSQNFSNAANAPAFHIAHGPGPAPTAMFIQHHLPGHALASVPLASEQFMSPGSLAFTHMATMSPAMYLDGTYSSLIPSALSIPSQNPMRPSVTSEEEVVELNAKVSTSNTSTTHSAPVTEWKTTFLDSGRVPHPSGHFPPDSYPSTVQPHILMPTPYPFFHASRLHQQQSSYPLSSEVFALRKDRPVVGLNSTNWPPHQDPVAYSVGSYPSGSGGVTLPPQGAIPNAVGTVVQVPHPLATSSIVQSNNVPFSETSSLTAHSQRFVIPTNTRSTDVTISTATSIAASSLSYGPLRRHTNSSGFEEPEILTAKNDTEDTHYMSEEEEVIEAAHGTVVATGNSRTVRHENAPAVNKTDVPETQTQPIAPDEPKKSAQSHMLPVTSENEYMRDASEEGSKSGIEQVDLFQAMYPEEKLRHLNEEKISELRNHHRAIMDLLNSKDRCEGRSPQEYMSPVVSFTMLPSSSLLSQGNGVVYRSHIVPDNYLHTANRSSKSQVSPGEKTVVANVINDPSLVAVPSIPSGAMPNFVTSDNTYSPSALVPGVSGANSRAHFFYPSNGLPQAQPQLLYLYESPLYSNPEIISTESLSKLSNPATEFQTDVSKMAANEHTGTLSGEELSAAPSVVENTSNFIVQNMPPSSLVPMNPAANLVTPTDEVVTGVQRKVGRFQVQVIPIAEKNLTAPVSSSSQEPLQAEPTTVSCIASTTQPVSSPLEETPNSGATAPKGIAVASTIGGTTHVSRFRRARIEECFEAWEQNGNSIRDWRSKNPESNVVKMVKKSPPLNESDVSTNCPLCSFQNEKLDTLWQCNHKEDFNPHFNVDLLPKAEMWLHGERHAIQTNILSNYGLRHHPLVESDAASYMESVPLQPMDDIASSQKGVSSLIMQPRLSATNRHVLRPAESASLVSVQGVIMSTGITSNLSNYQHFRTAGHTHAHNCHPVKDMAITEDNSQTATLTMASSNEQVTNEMKTLLQNTIGRCHAEHYHSASSSPPHNAVEFQCTQLGVGTYEDGHQRLKKCTSPPRNSQFYPNDTPELHSVSNCASQPSQAKPPPGSPRTKNQLNDLPPQELVNCVRPDPEGILTNPTLERFHMKLKEEQKLQNYDTMDNISRQHNPEEGSSGGAHEVVKVPEEGNSHPSEASTEAALLRLEERIAESLDQMRETLLNCFRNEIQCTHDQIKYLMEQNQSRQRHWESVIMCLRRFVPPEIFDSLWQLCTGGPDASSPTAWNMPYRSFFVGTAMGPSGQQSVPEENIHPSLTMSQYAAAPAQTNVMAPSFNPSQVPGGAAMPQFRHYFSTAVACDKPSAIPVSLMQTIPVTASHPFNGAPRVSHC